MSNKRCNWKNALLMTMFMIWMYSMAVLASSNDNSLASLGITTEGAVVSPEFVYSVWEYDVTVPAGTQTLELSPVPSNGNAWIVDVVGEELVDGKATVQIIVSAENGNQFTYTLYVTADASEEAAEAVQTEVVAETEEEETETEPETEDPRYVRVDRNSLQAAEETISALKEEGKDYRDRLGIMMKILYGLIGFCVILLFVVINLILKKKDLKKELEGYREYGQPEEYCPQGQGGYEPQAYENAPYEYDQQSYENDQYGYDQQSYENDQYGYDRQSYENDQYGYDQQSYGTDSYGYENNNYEPSEQQLYEETVCEETVNQKEDKRQKRKKLKSKKVQPEVPADDDPATVPKPSRAKKKEKRMPEYEEPQIAEPRPQTKRSKSAENVELTMIDL